MLLTVYSLYYLQHQDLVNRQKQNIGLSGRSLAWSQRLITHYVQ